MADSVVTVRDVFDLPHAGSREESSPRWQTLRQWINEELQGVKTSAFDDVGGKIEDLLEIPITDIFIASWKKTDAIKELLEESRKAPDSVTSVELGDHSIKSQHRPHIEVRNRNGSLKKIEFTLRLLFRLKAFSLRIQNGSIQEMQTGECEMQGALEYQGLAVAERKNAAIELPATVALEGPEKIEVKELVTEKASQNGSGEKTTDKKAVPLEPPKLEAPVKQVRDVPVEERPVTSILYAPKLTTPADEVTNQAPETVPEPKPPSARAAAASALQSEVKDLPPDTATTEAEEEREVFVI